MSLSNTSVVNSGLLLTARKIKVQCRNTYMAKHRWPAICFQPEKKKFLILLEIYFLLKWVYFQKLRKTNISESHVFHKTNPRLTIQAYRGKGKKKTNLFYGSSIPLFSLLGTPSPNILK